MQRNKAGTPTVCHALCIRRAEDGFGRNLAAPAGLAASTPEGRSGRPEPCRSEPDLLERASVEPGLPATTRAKPCESLWKGAKSPSLLADAGRTPA